MISVKKINKKVVYVIGFILLLITGMVYKFFAKGNLDGITVLSATNVSDSVQSSVSSLAGSGEETDPVIRKISVYICGEVNTPGIYEVEDGTILNDVAKLAGGFTDKAALDELDLVYRFTANTSVYIPGYEDLDKADSFILRRGNGGGDGSEGGNTLMVNINTASKEQLITLPGIGESTAMSIISYRKEHSFDSIEDIMKVSGIGEAKFERIKEYICVSR